MTRANATDADDVEETSEKRIIRLSPSQLVTFQQCNRKWSWERIYKYRSPPSPSQALGTEIHAQLEDFVENSNVPTNARALEFTRRANAPFNSGPIGVWKTEWYFEIPIPHPDPTRFPNGYPVDPDAARRMIGYVDLIDQNAKEPEIVDYKSMGDLQYAKTDFELAEDVQLNVYAKAACEKFAPGAKSVRITHGQIQAKGAITSRVTTTVIDRDHVERQWRRHLQIVDAIETTRPKVIKDVAPNYKECSRFRGCPHKQRCGMVDIGLNVPINPTSLPPTEHHKAQLALSTANTENDINETESDMPDPINPPDSTRRPEGTPGLTIDNIAPEHRPKIPGEKKTKSPKKKGTPPMTTTTNDMLAALAQTAQASPPNIERPPLSGPEALLARTQGQSPITAALPPPMPLPTPVPIQSTAAPPPQASSPSFPGLPPGWSIVMGPNGQPQFVPTPIPSPAPAPLPAGALSVPAPAMSALPVPPTNGHAPVLPLPMPTVQAPVLPLPMPTTQPAVQPATHATSMPGIMTPPPLPTTPPVTALPPGLSLPVATTQALGTDPLVTEPVHAPVPNIVPGTPGLHDISQASTQVPGTGSDEPAKRGRPKGSKNKTEGVVEEVYVEGTLEDLLIDCMPVLGHATPPVHLSTFLAPICEKIRTETKLDWQLHEFRKGQYALTTLVQAAPLPRMLIVDSTTPMAKIVLEVLIPRAKRIWQGTR